MTLSFSSQPSSRRDFLKSAGCLTIAFVLGNGADLLAGESIIEEKLPESLAKNPRINAWLEVLADGRVRVLTGKTEIGQGIRTAVAQLAAEELNLSMDRVEVVLAETDRTPDERYTSGSASIESSGMSIRYAAAAAREQLLALAAQQLNVKASQLRLTDGTISTADGRKKITFTQLLKDQQLKGEVKLPLKLKSKSVYTHVGKAVLRDDIERMVRAQTVYVQDLRFPGMVHARVLRPPSYGGKLARLDTAEMQRQIPGLLKTVIDGSFIGFITTKEYQAKQAQDYGIQHAQWTAGLTLPTKQPLPDLLTSLPAITKRAVDKGNMSSFDAAGPGGTSGAASLSARYFKPYLMHGSVGPSCAVALFEKDMLHIWSHSQGVYPLRATVAALLKMPPERVHIKAVPGSGCYGHNGADDVAADAALLARAYPGRHVRLQWSRDDEHAWEPYGSAMLVQLEARLNETGRISHWQSNIWSDTHSTRPGSKPESLLAARLLAQPVTLAPSTEVSSAIYRNGEPLYDIANQRLDAHYVQGPLRVSALRGLGAFGNVFAIESFMDELAAQAKQDPWEFRLRHLTDERAKAVIRRTREMIKNERLGPGEGFGLGFAQYKNQAAYCAVVAKVHVAEEMGTIRALHLWAAIDAGETINPDGLKNQTEGGLIQASSWTLKEEVLFNEQQITSRQWETYPIFRFDEVPAVTVSIINRPNEKPLGAGEAAQGPTSAALANAVFQACGKRIRSLPIRPEKLVQIKES
ncbi:molybdopterin cofactor-binding domain-containing protein [Hymenobacter sp. HD11105]